MKYKIHKHKSIENTLVVVLSNRKWFLTLNDGTTEQVDEKIDIMLRNKKLIPYGFGQPPF